MGFMKAFKTFDYVCQIILLVVALFSIVIFGFDIFTGPAMAMYFILGGWQVISVIIHLFLKEVPKDNLRKIYHVLLISVIAIGLLCLPSDAIISYMVGILLFSPVMAIIYLVCCYRETQRMTPAVSTIHVEAKQETAAEE